MNASGSKYVILCVDDEPDVLAALVRDVGQVCGSGIEVTGCNSAEAALNLVAKLGAFEVRVPLVFADHTMPNTSGVDLLLKLHAKPGYRATRKVLLVDDVAPEDVTRALNQGALHRTLCKPWTSEALRDHVRTLCTSFFSHHAPEDMRCFPELVDAGQRPRAQQAADLNRRALNLQVETLKRSFLANMDMTDEEAEGAMGAALDEALNEPPRREHPAGSILLRQGDPVDTVSILVSGEVELSRKAGGRDVVLHTQSSGRIIGLLSLAHRQQAFYTCRAVTDVTVIPLSLDQLETALQANPWLSGYLVTTLLRSMAKRSNRTAQLMLEVDDLNGKLQAERDQLADALKQLADAQTRLVESEKMAQLGQLSAGVAHELNNPIAAIERAVEFLSEDLVALLGEVPGGETIKATMLSALTREPLSTREQRKRRAALAEAVGDDALAQRLINVGITTPDEYREQFRKLSNRKRDHQLTLMERYYKLGTSLRNLSTCSERVSAIVASLRSYARADEAAVANVDLHEGIEGTLLMLGHALRQVEVVKEYAELPTIECRVGEMNQVWTNIISNAVQAMENKGTLRIDTDMPDADHIRVRITDSGRGVPPDKLDRVFELNFTTRQGGQASFGLGMGLTICRQIVNRHGGTISIESEPGRTCITVVLPVRRQRLAGES